LISVLVVTSGAACSSSGSAPLADASKELETTDAGEVDGGDGYQGSLGPGLPGSLYPFPKGDSGAEAGKWDALPAPPQVVDEDGGILASPVLVAVFFANEDQATLPTLETFYKGLGGSPMWKAGEEYGVGPAHATIVVLPEAAPATIDDTTDSAGDPTELVTWLLSEVAANALPAPTAGTTYLINYPAGTKVTANGVQCSEFDGYHSDLQNASGTETLSYAVIPHCTDMGSSYLDTFTTTVSHEAIEAATDPYPDYAPAWSQADDAHLFFDEANTGSEIADMCENDPEADQEFAGFPFKVQRVWSNKAALAGHDPCVPEIPGRVFVNAVPELPDTGTYEYYKQNVTVSSVAIPVGGTRTTYVDLYSDGKTPDWDVIVVDYNYFYSGDPAQALLDITMPVTSGNDGDKLPVTITVKAAGNPNANMQLPNTELFVVYSSQGNSVTAPAHMWYGLVTN
jgi:hypothetical protein